MTGGRSQRHTDQTTTNGAYKCPTPFYMEDWTHRDMYHVSCNMLKLLLYVWYQYCLISANRCQCCGSVKFWYRRLTIWLQEHFYKRCNLRRRIVAWLERGSKTFWYGSGSRSCSFCLWLSRCQQKIFFQFFSLLVSVGTFPYVFKDKKSLKSYQKAEIKVFLFFACW